MACKTQSVHTKPGAQQGTNSALCHMCPHVWAKCPNRKHGARLLSPNDPTRVGQKYGTGSEAAALGLSKGSDTFAVMNDMQMDHFGPWKTRMASWQVQ